METKINKKQLNKKGVIILIISMFILAIINLYIFGIHHSGGGFKEVREWEECRNLQLEDTTYCLMTYVAGIYNFTEKNDTYNVTLEDVKKTGGDCHDYSLLYAELSNRLGFYSSTHRIETDKKAHRFAVIMDDTGYCIIDLLSKPKCEPFY